MKKTRAPHRHMHWMQGASLEEIERVYRQRLPDFRRVAAAITGDRDAACDAVQEGFAIAVRKRETFRDDGPLEAWLWRVVTNAAREHNRRRKDLPDPEPPTISGRNGAQQDDGNSRVRVALALMPERQRLALFLRYYADLDYKTMAEILGIAIGTVGVTLNTARANLRELLEEAPR